MSNALPADDLCVENAIMLKRFNRYPLIIDPSGQATEFLLNEYKDKKIMKTRFVAIKLCANVGTVIVSLSLFEAKGAFHTCSGHNHNIILLGIRKAHRNYLAQHGEV